MKSNLQKFRRDILETNDADEKSTMINDARSVVSELKEQAQSKLAKLSKHLQEIENAEISHPSNSVLRSAFLLLALILTLGDCFLQTFANHIAVPATGLGAVVVASVVLAFGLCALAHGAATAKLFDRKRLMRSVRICRDLAAALGIAAGVALAIIFAARIASGALVALLSVMVPASLWIATEVTPVVGGLLWAAGSILNYPRTLRRKILQTQGSLKDATRFEEWLAEEEGRLSRSASDLNQESRNLVPHVVAFLVACLAAWNLPNAAAQTIDLGAHRPCQLYLDGSTSVNPSDRIGAVNDLVRSLPEFVTRFHCTELIAGTFFSAGEFTETRVFGIPPAPTKTDCEAVTPGIADPSLAAFTAFSGFRRYYKDRAREHCRVNRQSAEVQYVTRIRQIQNLVAAVFSPPFPKGGCTDLRGMLHGSMPRPGPIVIITDAAESCFTASSAFPNHADGPILFILVPSTGPISAAGPAVIRRADFWQRILPSLQAIPFTEVSTDTWNSQTLAVTR